MRRHRRPNPHALLSLLVLACTPLLAAELPRIRPELSDWQRTSTYADTLAFLEAAAAASELAHLTTFGYTTEGRPLPLLVVGATSSDADAVRSNGKLRIYLQGNIHGGEVCGKEALQLLVRQIVDSPSESSQAWLERLVLLIAPIYNADGNEQIRLDNRRRQNGPHGGMGRRRNAQDLDLNRDHMKLESPEARSLLRLVNSYDPQVTVDLHTTNGTTHAYHLTYAPPLHPGTDEELVATLRGEWLPDVTAALARDRWLSYYYGNLPYRDNVERGWYTFDHRPRFNNNYFGLRNRVALLSEAYSYSSFEQRVESTLAFVEAILDYAATHADETRQLVESLDTASLVGQTLPLRAELERTHPVEILLGEVTRTHHPYTGALVLERRDVVHRERLPQFGTFRGTHLETVPQAYLLPNDQTTAPVLDALRAHGIELESVESTVELTVQRFHVAATSTDEREVEKHRLRTVEGEWRDETARLPRGAYRARLDQPLGRLLFYLLEPRSDDGLVTWGFFDEVFEQAEAYRVLRVLSAGEKPQTNR